MFGVFYIKLAFFSERMQQNKNKYIFECYPKFLWLLFYLFLHYIIIYLFI